MVTLSSPGPPAPSRSALRCSAPFRRFFLQSFRSRRPSSSNPLRPSPPLENSLSSAPFLSRLSSSLLTRPVCHTHRQGRREEESAGHESAATNSSSALPSSPLARRLSSSRTLSAFLLFPSSSVSCVPTGSSASPLGQYPLLSPSSSPSSLCSFVLGRRNWSLSPATGLGGALARAPAVWTADLSSGLLPPESSRFLEQTAGISFHFPSASEATRRSTASASAFVSRFSSYAQAAGEAQRRANSHVPEFAQVFSASQAHAFRDFLPSTLGAASPAASPPTPPRANEGKPGASDVSDATSEEREGSPPAAALETSPTGLAEEGTREDVSSLSRARRRSATGRGATMPLLTVTAAASKRIRDIVDEYNEHVQRETSAARRNEPREGEEGGEEEGEEDGVETPEKARAIGIRIGLEKRGCSGLAYTVDVATESNASSSAASGKQTWAADEVVETAGGRLVVASDAVMFLVGTEVDFVDTELERKFVFKNPNEKQSCGCGKSFMA